MIEFINIKNNLFSKNSKYSICSSLKYLSLFILILSFSVNAQDLTAGQQQWQQYVPNWFPLFSIAALIGFGIVGISFMLARVFMLPQLESWARNELFEVVSSVFLVLIIIVSLGIIDNIFIAATNETPMNYSLSFTNSISSELMDRYIESVKLGVAIGTLSGPPIQYLGDTQKGTEIGNSQGGSSDVKRVLMVAVKNFRIQYLQFYAADVFTGHYNLVQSIALTSLGISLLSHLILEFINMIAIPVVIPLGLLLSMFTFSRKMGRTLIAFGVGLYIFVPLSIIIASTMYNSAFKDNTSVPHINAPSDKLDVNSFANKILAINYTDFLLHVVISAYGIIVAGNWAVLAACVVGSVALSTICLLAAPVCAAVFTMICSQFIGGFSDTPLGVDTIDLLNHAATIVKISLLADVLDVSSEELKPLGTEIFGLGIAASISTEIFHLLAPNALNFNYFTALWNVIANLKNYELTTLEASLMAVLNKALATRLTDITLAYTPYIMQYTVPVMLIPFIMIFIVITGIRSLSPAIGGEVQILGVSELI
jgi:hypothetical protein